MVVLPDLGHGHPDSGWAAVLGRGEAKILRRGWGTRGRLRTLSGVAKSKGIRGVAEGQLGLLWVTGLDWTEAAPTGAALSYQLDELYNYTPDATHYEIYPYQKKVYQSPGAIYIKLLMTMSQVPNHISSCCTFMKRVPFLEVIPFFRSTLQKYLESCHMDEHKGRIIQTKQTFAYILSRQYSTTCVEATHRKVCKVKNLCASCPYLSLWSFMAPSRQALCIWILGIFNVLCIWPSFWQPKQIIPRWHLDKTLSYVIMLSETNVAPWCDNWMDGWLSLLF